MSFIVIFSIIIAVMSAAIILLVFLALMLEAAPEILGDIKCSLRKLWKSRNSASLNLSEDVQMINGFPHWKD